MKIKEEMKEKYQEGLKNNQDPYGQCIYMFAERWANAMEERINNSVFDPESAITAYAEECGHEADTEGITGFMYGMAVSILSDVWEYGEILRKWHNRQYDYDGDGVVNPAILSFG